MLAGFASADAWYDAIVAATHMEKNGQLSHAIAERVRYPRAYWDLFSSASTRLALDPYLVLALSRQESLFNPKATSSSNARGLMQLIPSTARKMASQNGMDTEKIRLYDPSVNVQLGTTYLKNLFEMFTAMSFAQSRRTTRARTRCRSGTLNFPAPMTSGSRISRTKRRATTSRK